MQQHDLCRTTHTVAEFLRRSLMLPEARRSFVNGLGHAAGRGIVRHYTMTTKQMVENAKVRHTTTSGRKAGRAPAPGAELCKRHVRHLDP